MVVRKPVVVHRHGLATEPLLVNRTKVQAGADSAGGETGHERLPW